MNGWFAYRMTRGEAIWGLPWNPWVGLSCGLKKKGATGLPCHYSPCMCVSCWLFLMVPCFVLPVTFEGGIQKVLASMVPDEINTGRAFHSSDLDLSRNYLQE